MALQIAGETTHFIVQYDPSAGPAAIAAANAVLASCEVDLLKLSMYMPYRTGTAGDFFVHRKVAVNVLNDLLNGPGFSSAKNFGFSPDGQCLILINPFSATNIGITDDYAAFLFVAEMAEILMSLYNWDAGSSQGEALSRIMAEELHPASSSNFVNSWLSWPHPRPDWISRNEPAFSGPLTPRGDLDPVAYGCGIIFIYFLRYQLNIPYYQICTCSGTLLSDRYRTLTGAPDDPATRVGNLLDSHFGTGNLNLVGNNPFPLYDGDNRKIILAFSKPQSIGQALPDQGLARVKPFFTCPAGDYPFSEVGWRVTQTIAATTVGIGFPDFEWSLNGQRLFSSQSGDTVTVPVDVPQPGAPDHPQRQNQTFTFDYLVDNQFTRDGGSSTLTVSSLSFGGDYQLEIHVTADEQAVPSTPVAADQGIVFRTRTVFYGGTYSEDRTRCEKQFAASIKNRVHQVFDALSLIHNLPDPPPPGYIPEILQAAERIRQELAHLATSDHEAATKIAQYAAAQVGVPAHIFLKGAHDRELTT